MVSKEEKLLKKEKRLEKVMKNHEENLKEVKTQIQNKHQKWLTRRETQNIINRQEEIQNFKKGAEHTKAVE
jgi:hypothetical protein